MSLALAASSLITAIVLMRISGPEQAQNSTDSNIESNTSGKTNTHVESPVIIERKDGNILWQLRAADANQQRDGNMHLRLPTLVLYTESQKEINISSQQAWFNPITRNLRFEDKVLVRHEEWSLSTAVLLYSSNTDELLVPGTFKLWGKSIKARGKNMRMQRQTEQITVHDGIWIKDSDPHWQGVTAQ